MATLEELLNFDAQGGLSRIAQFYDDDQRLVAEYKTIPIPDIDVTECLKRSYLYNNDGSRSGEQAKIAIWTQYLEDLVSPPINNITITNSTMAPGLPSGTKVADIVIDGGVAPIVITLSSNPGSLFRIDNDDELTLNAPSSSGTYPITIQATDDDGKVESQNFNITVTAFSNTKSLQFDGVDERVDFGTNADFRFERTDPYSISGWFKTSAGAVTMHMFGTQSITATPRGWSVKLDTAKSIIGVLSNSSSNQIAVKTVSTYTDGLWHNFVVTYSGSGVASGMKIYVDGTNQSLTITNDSSTLTTVTSNALRAGCAADTSPTQFFNGNLDELAIWNKELSAGEVTSLYNSGVPSNLLNHSANANLLHYYRMGDDDTFPTITDNKGLSNGTCINMESLDIKTDAP